MDAILERCAGLDVHQETVVACVLFGELDKKPRKEVRTFETTTSELLSMADWLIEKKCSHVAMESTGVYWKPIWNILEGCSFELMLANAQRIKNVPGRKTDVKDAEWLAKLLRCGLIESSFVPTVEIRDLRDLTRYRKKLVNEATQEKNRIHKILQDANIKITTYLSDIFGVSGRNILQALITGKQITNDELKVIVKGKARDKIPQLVNALNSRLRPHHIDMIRYSWEHLIFLERTISDLETQINRCLAPYREEIQLLDAIPSVDETAAAIIVAEIGTDMSVFPTDKCLCSWAGVTPGNNESGGKKKQSKSTPGNKHLKAVLCECAWAAAMTKDTRFHACYWRWVKRMGKKKALVALAHLILKIAYHVLKTKTPYHELGPDYLPDRTKRQEQKYIKSLEAKGYKVEKVA